jgi:hypothetical protein
MGNCDAIFAKDGLVWAWNHWIKFFRNHQVAPIDSIDARSEIHQL